MESSAVNRLNYLTSVTSVSTAYSQQMSFVQTNVFV